VSGSREEVLTRVRNALQDVPHDETPEDVTVPRAYRRGSGRSRVEIVDLFIGRLSDYRATVRRVGAGNLPAAIREAVQAREVQSLVVPADVPAAWLPEDIEFRVDEALPPAALDASGGVLTGCALAIAETGTIVLDGGPSNGRRAITLIPDYHLCVVFEDQIVAGVPQAMEDLRSAARARRPITLISGPSATSDIELNRVEGVHGPRTLEVLLVAPQVDDT
jgi:L-lactate dehydrogenase complex protein LldG